MDVEHATFEDWWEPFTLGVAPSGAYVAGLEPDRRAALRDQNAKIERPLSSTA